jgi:hypothetical protein
MITARLSFTLGDPPPAIQRRYAERSHGLRACMFCEQPIERLRAFRIDGVLTRYLFDDRSGIVVYGLCREHTHCPEAVTEARSIVEMDCGACNLASAEYDLVVLDSPPLLGFPEPLQMAAAVDGVIVVAVAGRTNRKALGSAVNTLKRLRANLVGVVLNEFRADSSDNYYYYHYHPKYYKHYGDSPF